MKNAPSPTNKILKTDTAGIKYRYNFIKVSTIIHIYIIRVFHYHSYFMKIFSVNSDKKNR